LSVTVIGYMVNAHLKLPFRTQLIKQIV